MQQETSPREDPFVVFLKKNANIRPEKVSYYLTWIRKFINFCLQHHKNGMDALESFTKTLQKSCYDWQVEQARAAVKLHLYYKGLSKITTNPLENPSSQSESSLKYTQEWEEYVVQMRRILRLQHKSYQTEKTYLSWVRRFSVFLKDKDPKKITEEELKQFLSFLAVERKVSASTQQQAFNSMLFLFRHILDQKVEGIAEAIRSRVKTRLPVILDPEEIIQIFQNLIDPHRLVARLKYQQAIAIPTSLGEDFSVLKLDKPHVAETG